MAKTKEISVEVTFTKNLGNYQSVKIGAAATLTLEAGDDPGKVYDQAWEMVGEEITEQLSLFEGESKSGVRKGLS